MLIAAVVGVLAWYLAISPQVEAASDARTQAELEQGENDRLETQVLTLQALAEDAPAWIEEMTRISMDLPPRPGLPGFTRVTTTVLEDEDLPVMSITFGDTAQVVPTFPEPEPEPEAEQEPASDPEVAIDEEGGAASVPDPTTSPEPADTEDPAEQEGTEDSEAPVEPSFNNAFEGLVGIPVVLETQGSPEGIMNVVSTLQSQLDRFYTVTSFTITRASPSEAGPGVPALDESDWEVSISGLIFSLIDPVASFPPDNDGELPGYELDDAPENVFVPLPGTEEDEEA